MTVTEEFAKFIVNQDYNRLPAEVVEKVRMCVFHALACTFAGHHQQVGDVARAYLKGLGLKGTATTILDGLKDPADEVALVNSVIGQSTAQEDIHGDSSAHSGTMVIPTSLALGEEIGCSGKEFIVSVVVGYETLVRIGMSMFSPDFSRRFRPSGIFGPYGTCAAASKLLKLKEVEIVNALGMAGNLSAGLNQWALDGSTEICFQNGFATRNGMTSARLGKAGILAARSIVDGFIGAWSVYGKQEAASRITADLGTNYEIMRVYYKPAPACAYAQSAASLALKMVQTNEINPNDIARIEIRTFKVAKEYPGLDYAGPFKDIAQAKMSQQFSVAAVVAFKELSQSNYDRFTDPLVNRIASVSTLETDDTLTGSYPQKQGCSIKVVLQDKRVITASQDDLKVFDRNQVIANFEAQGNRTLGAKQT
ncbi:MAG: MmgE/PrpD family protein, partial [Dehalococcoidia bacterium]